jgi:hypothetical protein
MRDDSLPQTCHQFFGLNSATLNVLLAGFPVAHLHVHPRATTRHFLGWVLRKMPPVGDKNNFEDCRVDYRTLPYCNPINTGMQEDLFIQALLSDTRHLFSLSAPGSDPKAAAG